MSAAAWNIAGIIASLVGVLTLFRYGMPYRTRTRGKNNLVLWGDEAVDRDDLAQEKRYDVIGWIGIALIIVGAGLQIVASVTPVHSLTAPVARANASASGNKLRTFS